ncbi:hypothetical protein F0U60_24590 [Archangium minus]|uniref:Uncharacterized protein n=1 Tax=Archangium minus TaxID=83450 RepID=A0ABY9WT34_9BACT|nr:hypothetical protein F0U60_24590 [Archangium minus]
MCTSPLSRLCRSRSIPCPSRVVWRCGRRRSGARRPGPGPGRHRARRRPPRRRRRPSPLPRGRRPLGAARRPRWRRQPARRGLRPRTRGMLWGRWWTRSGHTPSRRCW